MGAQEDVEENAPPRYVQYTAIKYVLFGINFVVWLAGAIMFSFGIYMRTERSFTDVMNRVNAAGSILTQDMVYAGAYILIGVGALILIVGFIGCIGSLRENVAALLVYFVIQFVIFFACLGAGILVLVQREYIMAAVKDALYSMVEGYKKKERYATNAINIIQSTFKCCGVLSEFEWAGIKPSSCSDYKLGCATAFYDYIWHQLEIIAGFGITFAIIVIGGMVFSMLMLKFLREMHNESKDEDPYDDKEED